MGEFDCITHYFKRNHINRTDVALSIGDDCALLSVPPTHYLAVSTDTLVESTHFLPTISATDLGYKSLAVNLSDLAAMGASPAWLSLAITLPHIDEAWLKMFSDALFEQLENYNMQLIGGDTTKGHLSLTLTVFGFTPHNYAMRRSGAKLGDFIYVSGTLGDSPVGLQLLKQQLSLNDPIASDYFIQRHLRPTPRVLIGQQIREFASSAIDISDGLSSDLLHILSASQCGAVIHCERLPFSAAMKKHFSLEQAIGFALTGGEDYELCFTVPERNQSQFQALINAQHLDVHCIGYITDSPQQVNFLKNDHPFLLPHHGYDHFLVK